MLLQVSRTICVRYQHEEALKSGGVLRVGFHDEYVHDQDVVCASAGSFLDVFCSVQREINTIFDSSTFRLCHRPMVPRRS